MESLAPSTRDPFSFFFSFRCSLTDDDRLSVSRRQRHRERINSTILCTAQVTRPIVLSLRRFEARDSLRQRAPSTDVRRYVHIAVKILEEAVNKDVNRLDHFLSSPFPYPMSFFPSCFCAILLCCFSYYGSIFLLSSRISLFFLTPLLAIPFTVPPLYSPSNSVWRSPIIAYTVRLCHHIICTFIEKPQSTVHGSRHLGVWST